MLLPLNLAMTQSEIADAVSLPAQIAWMACHFSPDGRGLANLPSQLPEGSMLILDDSIPCRGHSTDIVLETLTDLISRFHCHSVLLDFQQAENEEAAALIAALADALPCPVAAPPEYAKALTCPVFLPPAPLHMPLEKYLSQWADREIWLEAALCQERIIVDRNGASFSEDFSELPIKRFDSQKLCCQYTINVRKDHIIFTLFDTAETLERKMALAHSLGVTRAVGLYQELGEYFPQTQKPLILR
jgi:hypothetical protein